MNLFNQIDSFPASQRATYSASAEESVTSGCNFDFQCIMQSLNRHMYPDLDLLLSGLLFQLLSVYITSSCPFDIFGLKIRDLSLVDFRYLRTLIPAFQCASSGFSRYLESCDMMVEISGLVRVA